MIDLSMIQVLKKYLRTLLCLFFSVKQVSNQVEIYSRFNVCLNNTVRPVKTMQKIEMWH